MSGELRFDDRIVLVTGGSRGLGRAIARCLARHGATVVINATGAADASQAGVSAAEATRRAIEAEGGRAQVLERSVEEAEAIVEHCEREHGRLDAIVHSAGILRDASIARLEPADWQAVQRVHLEAAYRLARAAWPGFKSRGCGRLLFLSSSAGLYGNFGQAAYGAAKIGLWGLARTLAIEGERSNIRSNCIAPVGVTRMNEQWLSDAQRDRYRAEAVAPLAAYLCHEACTDSGELFEAAGGWIAKLRVQRSHGILLDEASNTPAEIARRWAEIGDFSAAETPRTLAESMALIDARTGAQP